MALLVTGSFHPTVYSGKGIQGQLHVGTSERPGEQAAHVLAEAARKHSLNLVVYKQQRYFYSSEAGESSMRALADPW